MGYRIPEREIEVYLRRQDDGSVWRPDAVLPSSVERAFSVTDHPVEQGLAVSDHVQRQPMALTLTCVVTENPTRGEGIGGPARVRQRLAWLEETGGSGRRVDIVTRRHGVFIGYALTRFRFPIDGVSRAQFDLELKEIRIASVTSIAVTVDQAAADADATDDAAVGAPDEVDRGEQPTTSTTADTATQQAAEADTSLLADLVDML